MTMAKNMLTDVSRKERLCKAIGIRLISNPIIVQYAKNAGFDSLFIDLEHSSFTDAETSMLTNTAVLSGLTPFVRVPEDCGAGYVGRLLDAGAMGIIFPHIESASDAAKAVRTCKFPPQGKRSIWTQQPALGLRVMPLPQLMQACNDNSSSVLLMIETVEAIQNVESIASVDGVDGLVIGCFDLSAELGRPGEFEHPSFRDALWTVSVAAKRNGKHLGIAGIHGSRALQIWAMNTLNVHFMLCQSDSNLIARSMKAVISDVADMQHLNGEMNP